MAAGNPFADPPRALVVGDVGAAHRLVLNKFAVVPGHFILATRAFTPQTHVLDAADLDAARACIRAYDARGLGLFCFFNSGPHSGASQPHRHLQLLPVAGMRDGLAADARWDVLADRPGALDAAPFAAFSEDVAAGASPAELHAAYLRLYARACGAVAAYAGRREEQPPPPQGPARISYNMAMTRHRLVVCPRLVEGDGLPGAAAGRLALNGTVLAGAALVKTEAEWDALRGEGGSGVLATVLARIGVPREAAEATRL